MSRRLAASVAIAACILIAGCSSAPADPDAPLVLVSGSGTGDGMSAIVTGPVSVDARNCVRVGGFLAVWPEGTTWDSAADALRLSDGTLVARGGSVSGGGGETTGSVALGLLADGQRSDQCDWTGSVALFNPGSTVTAGS